MRGTVGFLAEVGEWIVIEPRRPGQRRRAGEVVEILGDPGHELYRVRWEDDRETLVCRDEGLIVRHAREDAEDPVLVHEP